MFHFITQYRKKKSKKINVNCQKKKKKNRIFFMKKILCVAEKPSVAKIAARVLSNTKYKFIMGESKFNPNFEFTTKYSNEEVQVIFTSVLGHIFDTDFPAQYLQN